MSPMKRLSLALLLAGICHVGLSGWVRADEVATAADAAAQVTGAAAVSPAPAAKIDSGNTAWMLASSGLVLLMTPGLAFFYGGLVRKKNILSILMQCFMAMCLVTIAWVTVGYTLAFGAD